MRIKSIFALLFFTSALCAVESQLSTQFQNRFGPNSPIYNEPLYFSYGKKSKKSTRKKRTYREQIQKKLNQSTRKKKRPNLTFPSEK